MIARTIYPKHRGGLAPQKYLTKAQCLQLLECAANQAASGSTRYAITYMAVQILLLAGLRASEICRLQIIDTPVKQTIDVLYVRPSKHNVSRTVNIPPILSESIKSFVLNHVKAAKPGTALLQSEAGSRRIIDRGQVIRSKQLSYQSLWSKIHRLGEKAGVGNLKENFGHQRLAPHMFRHTFCTRLYKTDHDLKNVQSQAGHASIITTQIYAMTEDEDRVNQAVALGREFEGLIGQTSYTL